MVRDEIDKLRARLLDLTTRNRLLNFTHRPTSCLRVVDELADSLFARLRAGTVFDLDPVPEPKPEELRRHRAEALPLLGMGEPEAPRKPAPERWAASLGIDTDFDLPAAAEAGTVPKRHADKRIQTLLYRDQLEARARKLRSDARTAIEESGTNILFLAFGFLEWQDGKAGQKPCLAPLILLPVELSRSTARSGPQAYQLAWTGEDLEANLSLQRKLQQEHGVVLPGLADPADAEGYLAPEAYFRAVQAAVRDLPGWTVRRYVTLALFHFGKLLLYRDLDPERWPAGQPLEAHPLVSRLLGGQEGGPAASPFAEDPARLREVIDLELPLVDRADGSQARALLRALAGETMLIEGPPGTGKSQTITNLIAAALAAGKTVLFVSEKLAALEVVRRRLDLLGLGDFCLELHSHKTRKRALLDDLDRALRHRKAPAPAAALEPALARLRELRRQLERYLELSTTPVGALAVPLREVLFRAGRLRLDAEAVGMGLPLPVPIDAATVQPHERHEARRQLATVGQVIRPVLGLGGSTGHPWAGVSSAVLFPIDAPRATAAVQVWRDAAAELSRDAAQLGALLGIPVGTTMPALGALLPLRQALAELPRLEAVARTAAPIVDAVAGTLGLKPAVDARGLALTVAAIEAARAAPFDSLHLRSGNLLQDAALPAIQDLARRVRAYGAELDALRGQLRLPLPRDLKPDELRRHAAALAHAGLFAWLRSSYRRARARFRELAEPGIKADAPTMARLLTGAAEAIEQVGAIERQQAARQMLGPVFAGVETPIAALERVMAWIERCKALPLPAEPGGRPPWLVLATRDLQALRTLAALDPEPVRAAALGADTAEEAGDTATRLLHALLRRALPAPLLAPALAGRERLVEAERALDRFGQLFRACEAAAAGFAQLTGLDPVTWFATAVPDLSLVIARAERALAAPEALGPWLAYDQVRRQPLPAGVAELIGLVETGRLAPEQLELAYEAQLHDGLARHAFAAHPELRGLAGPGLDAVRQEFRALDAEVMRQRRAELAQRLARRPLPPGSRGSRAADFTELALLQRELGKQQRHLPIRQLVGRAGRVLQALKPCFMMGPLSLAQYLPPGGLSFDLIVIDEASQMRPEESLGALARAGQAVIVGDTNQLPPTSFFDRIAAADDQDAEEEGVAEGAESIMELAAGMLAGPERLTWHYRSHHESLIAFSNHHFYDGQLIIFPSTRGDDPGYGVKFRYVAGAEVKEGVNDAEARQVAAAVRARLIAEPERSLGVAAMNMRQADRIEAVLDELARDDPAFRALLEDNRGRTEPLFVKNLENVQGDERDVMLLSMTYGPSTAGARVPQLFGPINRAHGWRRLNVLFTRARQRMEVFSSMRSGDVLPHERSSRGVLALRDFLAFAETGSLGPMGRPTGRPPGSDFEVAVAQGLERHGYGCEPQLGVAGFFLDLAVRDPDDPGCYLLAVECDGASYHSSLTARDRDRLRQEVLESLGWTVARVWSTDWFRDPAAELRRLLARIEGLRAGGTAFPAPG